MNSPRDAMHPGPVASAMGHSPSPAVASPVLTEPVPLPHAAPTDGDHRGRVGAASTGDVPAQTHEQANALPTTSTSHNTAAPDAARSSATLEVAPLAVAASPAHSSPNLQPSSSIQRTDAVAADPAAHDDQFLLAADVVWQTTNHSDDTIRGGPDARSFAGLFGTLPQPLVDVGATAASPAAQPSLQDGDGGEPEGDEAEWVAATRGSVVAVPLERKNYHLTSHFAHPAAEAEYRRFVHRRGHLRDSAPFFAFATLPIGVALVGWPLDQLLIVFAAIAVATATGVACLILELLWRRAFARLPPDASPTANDAGLPRPQVLLEARFARYRRVVVYVGATLLSMVVTSFFAVGADSCGLSLAPRGTSRYDACVGAIHYGRSLSTALLAAFVQCPIEFVVCLCFPLATTAIVEFAVVPDRYESHGDTWVRLFMQAAFGCFLVGFVAVRDRRAREHFEAIVVAHVAHRRTLQAHQQTAVAVAALLPSGLARRAARVPSGAGAASAGALTSLLSELREERAAASVAVTEAADMAAFQRRYPNPRLTVLGLCHLFTLFDVGTQVFGVERAGTFGDAYLVTAGLCESEHVATVADLARYALWQLGLDEIATLPLRSCIVTGRLRGAVVGSERLPRYTVSGPALAAAVGALKAVPAQQVWACEQTAGACGVRDASRLVAVDLGGDARRGSTGSQAPTADAVPQRFVVLTPEDLVADHAAPLVENVASQSMSIARDGRAGSHYSVQSDRLVRATLEERRQRRRGKVLSTVSSMLTSGDAAVTSPLDTSATNPLVDDDEPDSETGTVGQDTTRTGDDASELVAMAGLGGWRFASDEVEAAFQREPRSLLYTSVFFVALSLFSVVVVALDCLVQGASVVDGVYDAHVVDSGSRGVQVGLLLPVVLAELVLFVTELCIHRFVAPCSPAADLAHRLFPLRAGLVIFIVAAAVALRFFAASSVVRNDPAYTALLFVPVLAWSVFDRSPWWFAGAAITVLVTVPTFALFLVGIDSHQRVPGLARLIACCIVSFAMVTSIVVRLRLQFAARYVARRRADAAQAAAVQLSALVDALVPPHMLQEAMMAAGAMELRRRLLSVPGGAPAAYDAELEEIEDKLTDLARVLRGDHADAAVDTYDEVVVVHVMLHRTKGAIDTDVVEDMWSTIEECLAEANEAYRDDDDDAAPAIEPADRRRSRLSSLTSLAGQNAHRPTAASETSASELADRASGPPALLPVHQAPTLAGAESQHFTPRDSYRADDSAPARRTPPLLIVSHLRDSLVLVGPLTRHQPRTVAAAGAAARFVGLLADRAAREAGMRVAVGLAAGEAAAALLGRGTMRYGVVGVAMQHAAALAAAAAGVSGALACASVVAATEHFTARYRASGEDALSGLAAVEHAWAIRGVGRVRPHVWRSQRVGNCCDGGIPASTVDERNPRQ